MNAELSGESASDESGTSRENEVDMTDNLAGLGLRVVKG